MSTLLNSNVSGTLNGSSISIINEVESNFDRRSTVPVIRKGRRWESEQKKRKEPISLSCRGYLQRFDVGFESCTTGLIRITTGYKGSLCQPSFRQQFLSHH